MTDANATEAETRTEEGWDFPDPATEAHYADLDAAAEDAACTNCGDTTTDGHLFKDICLRVSADQVPTPVSKWDDR
jgi:hypothetical protein